MLNHSDICTGVLDITLQGQKLPTNYFNLRSKHHYSKSIN